MTQQNKVTVLLIDDDEVDRESVHLAVGDDFHMSDAELGFAGLEQARKHRPDCILLDYRLPDIDGIDLLPQLVGEGIPVVMMTGAGNDALAVEAMKRGASDYIPKRNLSRLQLTKAIQRAVELGKMQRRLVEQRGEMENFVSTAAHDLRAPLRHIMRYAELAKQEYDEAPTNVVTYLNRVVDASRRMQNLLDALVDFSRSGRSQTKLFPVELDVVVEQALSNLSLDIENSNATVHLERLPQVLGHEPSLIELVQNLVSNAIKYAGPKAPVLHIDATEEAGTCTVRVSDNGIGIAPQYQERVFQPFRRLHAYHEIEGSGIGLASCNRILEHHRGSIWVESESGEGATFFFTLQSASSESGDVAAQHAVLAGSDKTASHRYT